jgi:hypothetical protein
MESNSLPTSKHAAFYARLAEAHRLNKCDLLDSEEVVELCRNPACELLIPAYAAFMCQAMREILKQPQDIKSIRSWYVLVRFAEAALLMKDQVLLNLIANCAEMAEAPTTFGRLMQVFLMCLGHRAIPEQVAVWCEEQKQVCLADCAVCLCRTAEIAHAERDRDALKALMLLSEEVLPEQAKHETIATNDLDYEMLLMKARYDDSCGAKIDLEPLCAIARKMQGYMREKFCREIATTFPHAATPERCAICLREFCDVKIFR